MVSLATFCKMQLVNIVTQDAMCSSCCTLVVQWLLVEIEIQHVLASYYLLQLHLNQKAMLTASRLNAQSQR